MVHVMRFLTIAHLIAFMASAHGVQDSDSVAAMLRWGVPMLLCALWAESIDIMSQLERRK